MTLSFVTESMPPMLHQYMAHAHSDITQLDHPVLQRRHFPDQVLILHKTELLPLHAIGCAGIEAHLCHLALFTELQGQVSSENAPRNDSGRLEHLAQDAEPEEVETPIAGHGHHGKHDGIGRAGPDRVSVFPEST